MSGDRRHRPLRVLAGLGGLLLLCVSPSCGGEDATGPAPVTAPHSRLAGDRIAPAVADVAAVPATRPAVDPDQAAVDSVPRLAAGLAAGDPAAAAELVRIGPRAIPGILDDVRARGAADQARSSTVLASMGGGALPAITDGLQDQSVAVRTVCALALLELGSAARPALPALRQATSDPDQRVRYLAETLLEKLR